MVGNIQKLMKILQDQEISGVESCDWDQLNPRLEHVDQSTKDPIGNFTITLEEQKIQFIFNKDEQLIGICNWKC